MPKYKSTWDPAPVLSYLKNKFPNEQLSLQDLTQKTVTLLALITAQRVQTLTKIDLKNIKKFEQHIEIKISDIIKTSGPNRFQPCLVIPFFQQDPTICVASALQCYLDMTEGLRNPFLFL